MKTNLIAQAKIVLWLMLVTATFGSLQSCSQLAPPQPHPKDERIPLTYIAPITVTQVTSLTDSLCEMR